MRHLPLATYLTGHSYPFTVQAHPIQMFTLQFDEPVWLTPNGLRTYGPTILFVLAAIPNWSMAVLSDKLIPNCYGDSFSHNRVPNFSFAYLIPSTKLLIINMTPTFRLWQSKSFKFSHCTLLHAYHSRRRFGASCFLLHLGQ